MRGVVVSVFNISDSSPTTGDSSPTTGDSSATTGDSSAQVSVSGFETVDSTAAGVDSAAGRHERARASGGPVVRRGGSSADGVGSSLHYADFSCSAGVVTAVAAADALR